MYCISVIQEEIEEIRQTIEEVDMQHDEAVDKVGNENCGVNGVLM